MNQKEEEKLIIQHFRKNCPDFPKGRLIPSESPDFVLKIMPKKSIGIELTELFPASNLVSEIHTAIGKKEGKLPSYRQMNLTEIWLIIHTDDALTDFSYNLDNKFSNLRISNSFDRVYLFDLFSNVVFKIRN